MIMDRIALILAIIGGLNWGSVGLFRFDLVAFLCGGQTAVLSRVIYTLVGLAALWFISLLFRETLAAVGPTAMGKLFDATGWTLPLAILAILAVVMAIFGYLVGKPHIINE